MNPTPESTDGTSAAGNTASDEASELAQLRSTIDALAAAVTNLDTAASLTLAIGDTDAHKLLQRLSRQAKEIKQIYTAGVAMIKLQHVKFVTRSQAPTEGQP